MTAALEVVSSSEAPVQPRAYDVPDITARGFLEACMRSPNFSLALRIDAANMLKLEPPQPTVSMVDNEEPVIKYIIPAIPS